MRPAASRIDPVLLAPVLAAIAALVVVGCGSSRSAGGSAKTLRITERDFHISAPKRAPAGDVRLVVRNDGPDAHELILVRAPGGRLPLRADGLTIDEDAVERAAVATLEPGAPGSLRAFRVRLAPGHYVLFCNMFGHFMGGMRADLVVA